MESGDWSLDRITTAAAVVRVINDLNNSSEEKRDLLLCELMCAAWGDIVAQNQ